jgi:hypothetical protein
MRQPACRACRHTELSRVLDLGKVPVAKHFPLASEPVQADEATSSLAMDLCGSCGLAQLAGDDTVSDEPRGLEPQALKDQAAAAISMIEAAGWLRGDTVREFGSPHGGTWLPLMTERGFTTATGQTTTVLDSFGIMHAPDQQEAFRLRAQSTAPGGVLLLQYHSLATILSKGQWNSLRDGHFAYYSLTALSRLLSRVGMQIACAWEFDLYGGTVLIAAVHEDIEPDDTVRRIMASERALGVTDRSVVGGLQHSADLQIASLREWLGDAAAAGHVVYAYGAASRAVSLFSLAQLSSQLVRAVADASPAKQGRRMPTTNIPIVSPEDLVAAEPDLVYLTLPDLLPEVSARYPELGGRWKLDDG